MKNNDTFAPVVLFAYMRPEHLRLTVESLAANPEAISTALIIYCDAAKLPEHRQGVEQVRAYVETIEGFLSVRRIYQESNLGLSRSIISGVTEALLENERVIVLEDDLVLSPHFLRYMNDGLNCYRDDPLVCSIHGYWYPVEREMPQTFFLKGADCWGWATWSRAWKFFQQDGHILLKELQSRNLTYDFDCDGTYSFTRMLKGQIAGQNDSWAIRWHASCYLHGLLTLYPGQSLVNNVGHDGSGTHCGTEATFVSSQIAEPISFIRIPIKPSAEARIALVDFFRRIRKSWCFKLLDRVQHELKRLGFVR
jgi:Glycosyl transferase family 2